MKARTGALLTIVVALGTLLVPSGAYSQGVEVFLDVTRGGTKYGIAIPEFVRGTPGADERSFSRVLPEVMGNDLRFSGQFSVAVNEAPLPGDTEGLSRRLTDLASRGAHAAIQGSVSTAGQRLTVEFRLYDLLRPDFHQIASRSFWVEPLREHRRLAHRIADEIVFLFTGERGIADTKVAYVTRSATNKEIAMIDYDGFNEVLLTRLQSISLSPVWSPAGSAIAFTSFFQGYPYLFQIFPFNPRRTMPQVMSAWPGINSAAAWSPDGTTMALTLSIPGNPEIYTLRLGTSNFQRLTNYHGIDTDPTWAPNGREIAFSSDRQGAPQIWVMDDQGLNARRLTRGTYDTQPRWSPRGDTIVFTRRHAGGFDLWAIAPDGTNERRLTQGTGSNESAAWAPNGRHLVFLSSRAGRPELFTMLMNGTEQQRLAQGHVDASSPTWSPRLQ